MTENRHDISVPDFIKKNATRGLENLEFAGNGLTDKTKREARLIASGEISHDKAIRMQAWFKRHLPDFQGEAAKKFLSGESDRMSPGLVAWLLWGGPLKRIIKLVSMNWAECLFSSTDDKTGTTRPQRNPTGGVVQMVA